MKNNHRWGYAAGALWLALILATGLSMQWVPPEVREIKPDDPIPSSGMPIKDPKLKEDKVLAQRIISVARGLEDDFEWIEKRYQEIPEFKPPEDFHLTPENIEKTIGAYNEYVREFNYFKKKVIGKSPGLYRVIAFYGMHEAYHLVLKRKSFTAHGLREEEFFWTADRMFEAALFCVTYKLDREQVSGEKKMHLLEMKKQLYKQTGVEEDLEDGSILFDEWRLNQILHLVPRNNLELFLDYYQQFNWHMIHFDRPTQIRFDRDAIMAAAQNNPP